MSDVVQRNRELQEQAYGEPLEQAFRRYLAALHLNQAGLAAVLGVSPPMLSQLLNAQRVKIGNPAVLQRMHAVDELVQELQAGVVDVDQIASRLAEIKGSTGQWTRTDAVTQTSDQAVVHGMQALLRAVASGQEIKAAADLLATPHPGLAEVLRTYGLGTEGAARAHLDRHRDLF